MFNFFKKIQSSKIKKIELENIKNYDEAIKAIKFFIATLEWEKAKKAISEIKNKELKSYKELIAKIDEENLDNKLIEKEKFKLTKKYQKKQKELEKLKEEVYKKEEKYNKRIEKEKFKIRFKKIKQEINSLSKKWQTNQALQLLNKFLEENPWKEIVINFFNKEKKILLKRLEKEKIQEEKKLKQNVKLEALKLIWKTTNIELIDENEKKQNKSILERIKDKINFYKKIKKNLERKKLLDEINLLIEQEDRIKQDLAETKLENIHKWLIKEISRDNIVWYDFYWKILWAHKISWDTFWFNEIKKKYTFFIADATWHWIRAGFIITLLTRIFNKFVEKKSFKELIMEINNSLKQDLKSMNFITWIFFEIFKENISKINFVWLWHEPILIYRANKKEVEKVIPGWLAAWIRIIRNIDNIKVKDIELTDWDILLTYSDWLIEAKSKSWEYYWLDKLKEKFNYICQYEKNINKIYKYLIEDVKNFRSWSQFDDDLTILLLKRNIEKDVITDKEKILEELWEKEKLSKKEIRKLKWKTKIEIEEELKELKKEKQIQNIIKQLEQLWITWEILQLKSEAKRFIKEGFIHPKINKLLKKAIDNEQAHKISIKEKRLQSKYKVLNELLKKWDYSTVIKEAEDIISKDGNI